MNQPEKIEGNESENIVTETINPEPQSIIWHQKSVPHRYSWLTIGIVIALFCVLYFFLQNQTEKNKDLITAEEFNMPVIEGNEWSEVDDSASIAPGEYNYSQTVLRDDPEDYFLYYKNIPVQEGVSWLPKPLVLEDLGYFEKIDVNNNDSDYTINYPISYFQIGNFKGYPIIYVSLPCSGMCSSDFAFLTTINGVVSLLGRHSQVVLDDQDYTLVKLAGGVVRDNITEIKALMISNIALPSGESLSSTPSPWNYFSFFANSSFNMNLGLDSYKVRKFVTDTTMGPLFLGYNASEYGTTDYHYAIRMVGGLMVELPDDTVSQFIGDDRVPKITWNDGTKNTDPYRSDGLGGCGGGGPEIFLNDLAKGDIELTGLTSSGEKVLNIINPNHPLIDRVFDITQGQVYDYIGDTGIATTRIITREEFINNKGVIIVEDKFGNKVTFTNTKYGPQAECGKPVIYLYPEATTTISVKVDALITKSEPIYDNGWVATASPGGDLIVNGQAYSSLFWDGYGNGKYPSIKQGVVVKTEEAISTMEKQLTTMGFNEQEIADFSEFWSGHLPSKPYTRISWLQTKEMESLAKLAISPKPKTLLRAFVDYEGLDEPIKIEPQQLYRTARNGYVVVEWGGLLRQ